MAIVDHVRRAEKLIEPRLGVYATELAVGRRRRGTAASDTSTPADDEVDAARAARSALRASALLGVRRRRRAARSLPPGAPLRNPDTGAIIGDSPFMDSLIFIITLIFLVAGIGYGSGAKTITSSVDVINAITKTFAGLAGLMFMLLLISQFIAYFNYTQHADGRRGRAWPTCSSAPTSAPLWLLIGFILVIVLLDIIIPGSLPKWAIFAPIFVPLFIRLGVAPQTVLAAYRRRRLADERDHAADGVPAVHRDRRAALPEDAGIGTIISLMIPYTVIVLVTWILFFAAWFLLHLPMGPGYPSHL